MREGRIHSIQKQVEVDEPEVAALLIGLQKLIPEEPHVKGNG